MFIKIFGKILPPTIISDHTLIDSWKISFSDITVINHREIKILLFNVYVTVGKQKPPGGILLGDFCFPIIFNLPISQIFCQIVVG